MSECVTDHRQRLARESQLPSHQHHQRKAEEQKDQTAETVLNADHLVIGRENICSPPTELMLLVGGGAMVRIVMRFERSGCVHFRRKLSFQYPEPNRACKARNSEKFESEISILITTTAASGSCALAVPFHIESFVPCSPPANDTNRRSARARADQCPNQISTT